MAGRWAGVGRLLARTESLTRIDAGPEPAPVVLSKLPPRRACSLRVCLLELSEEADDLDPEVADALRASGFRFAVDDLGLKRSNFDRLLTGSIDTAKLDRRWLDDRVVLDSLLRTCFDNDLSVIAEGIETMEQLAIVYSLGVRLCQGYLIARPQTSTEMTDMLSVGRRSAVAAR